jgi:hypothetical protein
MAIPFHASVRIKLSSGMTIKNKADEVIGINVIAKTIKNKVAAPFRNVNFEIHFGRGIVEHEHLFDTLRDAGSRVVGENTIIVTGDGAWKIFIVKNTVTGDILHEKKFYKSDFRDLLQSPVYKPFLDDLIEEVMVKKMIGQDHVSDIDTDSYEEVRSALMDIVTEE